MSHDLSVLRTADPRESRWRGRRAVAGCAAAACMVTAALMISGPASAAAPPRLLKGVHRICTMGASITQYAARPGGYVWLMQHTLDALYPEQHIEVIDVGVAGNTSGDMLRRFQRDVVDRKPDLVTIKEGYNDVTRRFQGHPRGDGPDGADAQEYALNMSAMASLARVNGIRAVVMTPTIYEDAPDSIRNRVLNEYARGIRDLARQDGLPLVDPFAAMMAAWEEQRRGKRQPLTTDRVHLTPLGDAVLARAVLLALGIPRTDLDAVGTAVQDDLRKAAAGP